MKTAMQQLLERIEATINNDPINDLGVGQAMALKLMKSRIKNEWLEAEKEQIMEAFEAGTKEDLFNTWSIPEELYKKEKSAEYFQQTFKSDE